MKCSARKSASAKPIELNTVTWLAFSRPDLAALSTFHQSGTGTWHQACMLCFRIVLHALLTFRTFHNMISIHFIGGEKGGVGKSVTARVLAQYFIDKGQPVSGFDTDRSHRSFSRFYADYASPVVVDQYEGLDTIVQTLESQPDHNLIVDLAAQTSAPLARWIQDANLLELLDDMGVAVYFWHVMDDGKDAVDLLAQLLDTYGNKARLVVVQNLGRGQRFSLLQNSQALQTAHALGAQVIELPKLHEGAMRQIDQHNMSFWKAVNHREGPDGLGLMDRQRVKTWLKNCYALISKIGV
jgi:hypothetical protein